MRWLTLLIQKPVVVGQSFFNNADVNAIEVDETSSGSNRPG
ncbi:MAG: hypothetical protein R2788_05865 [Saprospiraceae bacterium]